MHPEPFDTRNAGEKDETIDASSFHSDGRSGPSPFSSHAHSYSSQHASSEPRPSCPECLSPQIESRHLARRIAAVIGVAAGATSGVVRTLQAAEVVSTGVKIGLAAGLRATGGPIVGPVAGTVASALVAALLEGAAGCALGVRFGEAVDRMILPNYRCLSCGHTFSTPIDSFA